MKKVLLAILFLLPTHVLGFEASEAKYPPNIAKFKAAHFAILHVDTEEDAINEPPMARFDFDEKLVERLNAYKFLADGILEFNRRKYQQAYMLFAKAKDQGSIEALYFMGSMMLSGHGVAQSESDGIKYLREAMNNGCRSAALDLGQFYLFKKNQFVEANLCLLKYPKDPEFKFYLGFILLRKNEAQGMKKIEEAAMEGCKLAQTYQESSAKELLELYKTKIGTYISVLNLDPFYALIKAVRAYQVGNDDQAFELFRKVSVRGRHSAEYFYLLGHMCFLRKMPEDGFKLFDHAAGYGYKPAAFDLGLRYYLGIGLEANKGRAFFHFERYPDAQFQYHTGLILSETESDINKRRGKVLIKDAAEKGYKLAQDALKYYFVVKKDEWGSYLVARK